MRSIIPLSAGWDFLLLGEGAADPEFSDLPGDGAAWSPVDLPHSMVELPFNNFDESRLEVRGLYRKRFPSPVVREGGSALLRFEGVAVSCELWLNGSRLGRHEGPYTPFAFETAGLLAPEGGLNELLVLVDSHEDPQVPPFGGVVDYLVYGGIYRGVELLVRGASRIEDVFARPSLGRGRAGASLTAEPSLGGARPPGAVLRGYLRLRGAVAAEASLPLGAGDGAPAAPLLLRFPDLAAVEPWDLDSPVLYDLELELLSGGEVLDRTSTPIGFREARFEADGFYLNGRRIPLRGLNRHQSWPHVGNAMGPGPQAEDARILARELGLDIVRTSHYPQSPHFLDACDRLGLLVFAELPGWQHIGGPAWKDRALADLGALIRRDRNHPSVVLWGVRINESQDDHEFYGRTNALAASLDPTRQRGGVRYLKRSELLEEVYTFNDFSHDGGEAILAPPDRVTGGKAVPLLVTEHNGHMFPTKRFDQEERLAEHARRHARVLDEAAGSRRAGAIGWCAFDYNTHKDFGSGDRICYHGVSDMYRIPKYAAFAYASQKDPSRGLVLEPATLFAKGERSAARILPFEVWTNCDAVDLYRSGTRVGRFRPDRKTYPHLPHPPVLIDDLIGDRIDAEGFSDRDKALFLRLAGRAMALGAEHLGPADKLAFAAFLLRTGRSFRELELLVQNYGMAWGKAEDDFELVGIVGGEGAIRRRFGADARAERLELSAQAEVLDFVPGGEWNAVRILARLLDQYGNPSPFAFLPLSASLSGPARILGPSRLSLVSGAAAFWVASVGGEGEIEVRAEAAGFPPASLRLLARAAGRAAESPTHD